MLNMPSANLIETSESQKRQYIDAESVFLAFLDARRAASEVRGSMIWRELRGVKTLIRTSAAGAQKSLGAWSDATQRMYDDFMARKNRLESRLKGLKDQLDLQQRLNRAQRVGRVPNIVVDVLSEFARAGIQDSFIVVGTHALYAYEAAAGVRVGEAAMATRDVDMLFDTRKRVAFITAMSRLDSSLIGLLRKVDPSFQVTSDQLYTAKNKDGFEVDIIRRTAKDTDPHPLRMSDDGEDFWACQVDSGEQLLSARRFEQVVVATSGRMALMRTVHPLDFARIKTALSQRQSRDPNKASKDALQAEVAREIVQEYLPHLLAERLEPTDERPRG